MTLNTIFEFLLFSFFFWPTTCTSERRSINLLFRCFVLLVAMILEWILDAVLLTLPIGTTIGTLRGIDLHRQATGQAPLFSLVGGNGHGSSGNNGEGNSSTIISGDNGITTTTYCGRETAITPSSVGSQYTCKICLAGSYKDDCASSLTDR